MKIKTFTSDNIPGNLQDGETMFETDTNNLVVQYGDRLFIFKPDRARDITGFHEDLHYPQGLYTDSVERYYITTSPIVHFDASHYTGISRTYTGNDVQINSWVSRSNASGRDFIIDTTSDASEMTVEHESSSAMPGIRFNTQSDAIFFTAVEEEPFDVDPETLEETLEVEETLDPSLSIRDVDDCTIIIVKRFNSVNPTTGTLVHPTFGTINTAPWNSTLPFQYDVNNVSNTWNNLIDSRGLWDQEINKWFHKSNTNQMELITITKQSNTRQVRTYFNGMIESNYSWTATVDDFVFDSIHPGNSTFYEILLFDRVLSNVTINIIFSYLKNKYPLEHAPAWPI